MASALRTLLLTLIAPVSILFLWVSGFMTLAPEPTVAPIFFWAGPLAALLVGLIGIATAGWRRFTRIAIAPIYVLGFLTASPFVFFGSMCIVRACPSV